MTKILFVDDEQAVLNGIKLALRKQRHVWEMVFAVGGREAVDQIAASLFDVVVSDMRMPDLDGAAVLAAARDHNPHTVRIILSGHSEKSALASALELADAFLSKPCGSEALRHAIEEILARRRST